MLKIYLLNPPFNESFSRELRGEGMSTRGGTLYYPIWLSYAAALLEKTGHKIKLSDTIARKWNLNETITDIKKFNPDLIVMDSNFASLKNDIKIAESIKYNLNTKIVLVGPPASQFTNQILENESIDFVARYEYDFTLKELAEKIDANENYEKVDGLSFKNKNQIIHNKSRALTTSENLDTIPFVSGIYKKYLNIEDYFLSSSLFPEVQIFTGRGCPNLCTFCSWPETLMGRKYRVRSVSNVLDEIEWIEQNLKVKEVFFEDDTFTISEKRVLEFCNGYEERGLSIAWACNSRADISLNSMKQMKKANCRLLIVGYESGSEKILQNIKKGVNIGQMKKFADSARKAGLLVHGDFIVGLPGETKKTIAMTKDLIKTLKPDILQMQMASPIPGTEFFDYCKENDALLTTNPTEYLDEHGHQRPVIDYPNLTNEEMIKEVNSILKWYYFSPGYIKPFFNQIIRKNGIHEFRRLLYSAKIFLDFIK